MSWSTETVKNSMTDICYKFWISTGKLVSNWTLTSVNLVRPSVTFYGNIVSNQGLRPDPKKVDVIVKMPAPKNKTEPASFLGMCNYLSMYIPCLSDVTSTPRESNRKNVDFTQNSTYDKVFKQAKLHVANAVTLKYFKPQTQIVIECDASGVGVGGLLLQNSHPVTFISQTLTNTQKRYSNIEHELLALVIVDRASTPLCLWKTIYCSYRSCTLSESLQ